MEDKGKLKNTKIQEIFSTMDYGEIYECTERAHQWIKNKENGMFAYVDKSTELPNGTPVQLKNCINEEPLCTIHIPEIDTIKNILSKSTGKIKWIDTKPIERAKILITLAGELEANVDLLSEIEIISRGILAEDTKTKSVPLLAQYFYFYASFAIKYSLENTNWKPNGIVTGVISNENALSNIGFVVAPVLAAGYNIVLQVGTKLMPAAYFILDLARKVGLPDDVLRLIPSDDGELLPYLVSEKVDIIALFVDLQNEKYRGINSIQKKILVLSSYKIPTIIFDDADLDSASDDIIEAAWGCQSLLPWSTNTLLIQENIFTEFIKKLKTKLRSTRLGVANDKTADISYPGQNSLVALTKLIKLAKSQGIEIFQAIEHSNNWMPTLFIGGKVQTNKVLSADDSQEANVVTVLPFRSIDEAVNLANNTRQGLAAAVWTENIGVINEVAIKLKVSNIWINGHGLSSADVTISPIKDSGIGYFGGREGFYEYVQIRASPAPLLSNSDLPPKLNNSVAGVINSAKKSQENWYKMPKINKSKILQQFAEYIDKNKKKLSSDLDEKWLESWIINIYDYITGTNSQHSSTYHSGFNLTSVREPRGVIAVESKGELNSCEIKLILIALYEGNCVVLLNGVSTAEALYKEFSKKLPSGVLNVIPYNLENVKTAAAHRELNVYIGQDLNPIFGVLPLRDSKFFTTAADKWDEDIYRKVTFAKNVWTNVGKSSTCSWSK